MLLPMSSKKFNSVSPKVCELVIRSLNNVLKLPLISSRLSMICSDVLIWLFVHES